MCFKLSKKQIWILLVVAVIGVIFVGIRSAFMSGQFIYYNNLWEPQFPSKLPYLYGFLIFGAITYLVEIIYNKIKEK